MPTQILPGLTPTGAALLTQLALRGMQAIQQEAQEAAMALEAAIKAASEPEAPAEPPAQPSE